MKVSNKGIIIRRMEEMKEREGREEKGRKGNKCFGASN